MKALLKLTTCLLIIFGSTHSIALAHRKFIASSDVEQLTKNIFEGYRAPAKVFNVTLGSLVFSETLPTHVSNGNPDIVVKPSQLDHYTNGRNENFKRLFIEYVLAHEIGHKIQYSGYKREVISATRGEGSVFLECDADILAGLIMTDYINTIEVPDMMRNNPSFNLTTYNQRNLNDMLDVYEQIFKMDQLNVSINTHPTHLQRLMAIKDGIMLGMCGMVAFTSNNNTTMPADEINKIRDLYTLIGKAIDFYPARDNPLVWAHLEAIRITNENNKLATNLIRYNTHKKSGYDGQDSYYDYSFMVYNENSVAVHFVGRVYTALKPNTDQVELVKKVPLDGEAFDVTIPANGSITISGKVKFIRQTGYTTNFILPGDSESLYYVFDANQQLIDLTDYASTDNDFTVWDGGSLGNIDDHIKDMVNKSSHFSEYKKGMSVSSDTTIQRVQKRRRHFEPTFKAGLEKDQTLVYTESTGKMSYQFYACSLTDSVEVRHHFDEINQRIKASYNGRLKADPYDDEDGSIMEDFKDSSGDVKIDTEFKYDGLIHKFVVEVSIHGK